MRRRMLLALAKAVDRRHEVSEAIFDSADRDEARRRVQVVLGVDETGAQAVLDWQLFRWSAAERDRLAKEIDELGEAVTACD